MVQWWNRLGNIQLLAGDFWWLAHSTLCGTITIRFSFWNFSWLSEKLFDKSSLLLVNSSQDIFPTNELLESVRVGICVKIPWKLHFPFWLSSSWSATTGIWDILKRTFPLNIMLVFVTETSKRLSSTKVVLSFRLSNKLKSSKTKL